MRGEKKKKAITLKDYLAQVLKPAIKSIIKDFRYVTAKINKKPTFIKDKNPTHEHKLIHDSCAQFRKNKEIKIFNYLSTNLNEKC